MDEMSEGSSAWVMTQAPPDLLLISAAEQLRRPSGKGWVAATTGRLSRNPARTLVFALLIGYALAATIAVLGHWYFDDAQGYWQSALRLRAGEPLYYAGDVGDPAVYRYAPWFAWVWVPLTYLPESVVMVLWGAVLVAAAAWLIWPARSPAAICLALLCFPDLLRVTSTGNVQPLLLALCAFGLTSRWGPLLIGLAASLKGWPLLFAGVWWRTPGRIALAAGVTSLLVAPALAYDLAGYPTNRQLLTPGTLSIALVVASVFKRSTPPGIRR